MEIDQLRTAIEERLIQIVVAALLIVALARWPYGYYQFLRVAVTLAAGVLAWKAYQSEWIYWTIAMAGIAVLFNPLVPVYMHRSDWAVIDPIMAVVFMLFPPVRLRDRDRNSQL